MIFYKKQAKNLSPALPAILSCARPDPRGAFLEASWNGIGNGARGRGSPPRTRDGTGLRLRSLRTGARSSLTERRFGASRKARPGPRNRCAGALRSAPLAREAKTEYGCAERRSGPLASSEGCDGRMPGRAKSASAGRMELVSSRHSGTRYRADPESRHTCKLIWIPGSPASQAPRNDNGWVAEKATRRLGYPTGIRTASLRSHLEVTWRIDL
jgi:hypothetical protein